MGCVSREHGHVFKYRDSFTARILWNGVEPLYVNIYHGDPKWLSRPLL